MEEERDGHQLLTFGRCKMVLCLVTRQQSQINQLWRVRWKSSATWWRSATFWTRNLPASTTRKTTQTLTVTATRLCIQKLTPIHNTMVMQSRQMSLFTTHTAALTQLRWAVVAQWENLETRSALAALHTQTQICVYLSQIRVFVCPCQMLMCLWCVQKQVCVLQHHPPWRPKLFLHLLPSLESHLRESTA